MTTSQTFFAGLESIGAQKAARRIAADDRRQLEHDTRTVNEVLFKFGRVYHDSVPLAELSALLRWNGFDGLDDILLVCGREGRLHESVGRNRWFTLTWYKMESGRYEIVAYLS